MLTGCISRVATSLRVRRPDGLRRCRGFNTPIRLAIDIGAERIHFNFSGTSDQVAGRINSARATVEAAVDHTGA